MDEIGLEGPIRFEGLNKLELEGPNISVYYLLSGAARAKFLSLALSLCRS